MGRAKDDMEARLDKFAGILEVVLRRIEAQDASMRKLKRAIRALAEMRAPRHVDIDALAEIRRELEGNNHEDRDMRPLQRDDTGGGC